MSLSVMQAGVLVQAFPTHSLKVATGEKEPRPGTWTRSLSPNVELATQAISVAAILQLQIGTFECNSSFKYILTLQIFVVIIILYIV